MEYEEETIMTLNEFRDKCGLPPLDEVQHGINGEKEFAVFDGYWVFTDNPDFYRELFARRRNWRNRARRN